jgi:hypothetical protein
VKCCGFVEFRRELRKNTQKSENLKIFWYKMQSFFIIWRFRFPDESRHHCLAALISCDALLTLHISTMTVWVSVSPGNFTSGKRWQHRASEGWMSLSKRFPHQFRLFCSKRYNFIQSPIDLNLIIKFDLSLLIWK